LKKGDELMAEEVGERLLVRGAVAWLKGEEEKLQERLD
jgi:hypothetical protein